MKEILQSFEVSYSYPVVFTRGVFAPGNAAFSSVIARAGPGPHRMLLALDSGLIEARPELIASVEAYTQGLGGLVELAGSPLVVRGGEICKSDPREVGELRRRIEAEGLCRHSFVVAIGGGSVLDAIGYGTATSHRGVRFIRVPTTVLAQNDAGVGTKNAINLDGRKNFIGTFAPPYAVINDLDMLDTLPERDMRSGIAEAIKVALIKDRAFFEELHQGRTRLASFDPEAMERMIVRCTELHLEHIRSTGDPFELGSARPLDFGHWAAHKLEEMSGYTLRHGEAVAVGVALDSLYSARSGMLPERDAGVIVRTLADIGFELGPPTLDELDIEAALAEFREHLGGSLNITLLAEIGRGVEVTSIDERRMADCISELRAAD